MASLGRSLFGDWSTSTVGTPLLSILILYTTQSPLLMLLFTSSCPFILHDLRAHLRGLFPRSLVLDFLHSLVRRPLLRGGLLPRRARFRDSTPTLPCTSPLSCGTRTPSHSVPFIYLSQSGLLHPDVGLPPKTETEAPSTLGTSHTSSPPSTALKVKSTYVRPT